MWEQTTTELSAPMPRRLGDMKAILRIMRPLDGTVPNPILRRRRLLADLCRLLGKSLQDQPEDSSPPTLDPSRAAEDLPPRLAQTLELLLNGAGEKQAANHMKLSRHTVHSYVKTLYRLYGVSSRGELLARHLKR